MIKIRQKIFNCRAKRAITSVAATMCIGIATPSYAELEEIVVTAQNCSQSIQGIGFAVSAFDGEEPGEPDVAIRFFNRKNNN